jgi:dipeptidyl aminopeptidase/acylaminoacyl peptidase
MSREIDDPLDERIRNALSPLEAMPPLRRPATSSRAGRRWAPLVVPAACVALLTLGVVVVVARRPAPKPAPGATTLGQGLRAVLALGAAGTIRLDGVPAGRGDGPVISPDGRSVAFKSDGVDGLAVRVFDGDTGEVTTVLEAGGLYGFAWSPDGQLLAAQTWGGVRVVDRSGHALVAVPDGGSIPVFAPDSTRIAYRTTTGVATIPVDGGRAETASTRPASPVAWRADGLVLLDGRDIIVTGTGRRIPLPGQPMDEGVGPLPIAASTDGRIVAFTIYTPHDQAAVYNAYTVDTDTGRIRTLPGEAGGLSADGSRLLVAAQACNGGQTRHSLAVLDTATLATRQTIDGSCSGGIAMVRDSTPIVAPSSSVPAPLAAAAPCRGSDLRITFNAKSPSGGGLSNIVAENITRHTCDLDGPVSIAAVDRSGAALPVTVDATLQEPQVMRQGGRSPVRWLDPGARAVVYTKLTAGCSTLAPTFLEVSLPDRSHQRLELTDTFPAACGQTTKRPADLAYEPRFQPG